MRSALSLSLSVLVLPLTLAGARPAEACGGLFCQPAQPVIQTGEQILFSVDRAAGTVDAIINIRYSGPAEDFAWILPLQSAPTAVQVGPQSAFQTVNTLTGPQFNLQFETKGACRDDSGFLGGFERETALDAGVAGPTEESGVQVLARREVGPYDTVVLAGETVEAIRTWLVDNGFAVTDAMMMQVVPYVQKGDVLLALKLRKDNDAGDIQPVHVTMTGNEVCVPLRLTAIAAVQDMDITVTVLSDEGRAVPENYFEVELNWARLDWFSRGSNYRELVADAADEGEGNAFTTEFAGSARAFDGQIYPPSGYPRAFLLGATSFRSLVQALADAGLVNKPGIGPILRRHAQGNLQVSLNQQATAFDQCPTCFSDRDGAIDVDSVIEEVWTRIVKPEERVQALFDARTYATRLYTLISPEEMGVDPEFAFRSDLPDVSNVHAATQVRECGFGGSVTREFLRIEDTGQEVDLERLSEVQADLPAASRVRQLNEGLDVVDNRPRIARLLGDDLGCSCAQRPSRFPGAGIALGLLGLGLVLRRRR